MAINKVIYGNDTLIDLSTDSLTNSNQLLKDVIGHAKNGNLIIGTLEVGGNTDIEDSIITRTITNINNDRVTVIEDYAFSTCKSLESANFPLVLEIGHYGFNDCSALKSINFPSLTTIKTYTFNGCSSLVTAEFLALNEIRAYGLRKCYSLTSLILNNPSICVLQNDNAFDYCYHILGITDETYNPNGLKDGYIYVPNNLVDTYKEATNWTYFSSQIKSISELR